MRQFLVVLDSILEQEGNQVSPKSDELKNLHLPIESILPSKDSSFQGPILENFFGHHSKASAFGGTSQFHRSLIVTGIIGSLL
jgi:hypothetical protein